MKYVGDFIYVDMSITNINAMLIITLIAKIFLNLRINILLFIMNVLYSKQNLDIYLFN